MNIKEICRANDDSGMCIAVVMKCDNGKLLIYGDALAANQALAKKDYANKVLTNSDVVFVERTS
jgi:hypothetical protein